MTRQTHNALLDLLQAKEARAESVTVEEILQATGWKSVTFGTYFAKGQLSEYLSKIDDGIFAVSNTLDLDPVTFSRNLSQSKHRRELGHNCKSRLAKALLKKSRDNMILALELYNRPSLENRLDSFVLCFCAAWEQLLKATLIERDGESRIFQPNPGPDGIRKTISLRECLTRYFASNNLIQKNIDRINYYRNQAVHLLMPEVQGSISRMFQSGVMNYSKIFHEFSQQAFLPSSHAGMLSLVGEIRDHSNTTIIAKYGKKVGGELISLLDSLNEEVKKINDIEFAIPLDVKLVFAKNDDEGNTVTLSRAEAGMEGLAKAIVVEKPVDRSKTHPFRTTDAVKEINQRISDRFGGGYVQQHFENSTVLQGKKEINIHDFQSIAHKNKWKRSNNSWHYLHENPETHYYSDDAIEECISKIRDNTIYLENARESYRNRSKSSGS